MRTFLGQLFQSWRLLRRQPGLAIAAVTALAMGIGFTTTMFGIVHGGTRALPVDDPHDVVIVQVARGAQDAVVRPYLFRHWQSSLASFEGLGAWRRDSINVSGTGTPDRLEAAAITPNTFGLVGVGVARGRSFVEADAAAGAPPVALISHAVWQTRFDGDLAIVGRAIRLDGVSHEIVGVAPEGFGFPINARVWTPLWVDPNAAPGGGEPIEVFGRLKDGVTPLRAEEELRVALSRLAAAEPAAFEGYRGRVLAFLELETPRQVQLGLQVLVIAVSLAFLVACANVANLLLARAASRSGDMALHSALGASRARLISQQLAETTLLAGIACALGLLIASAGLRFFRIASADILEAFWVDIRLDATVAVFASGLGFLAALAAGLVPALRATAAGAGALLKRDATGAPGFRIGRLGRVLVVVQLALACGLLVLTATFVRASASIRTVDLVFPARQILTTGLSVPAETLGDPAARARLLSSLRDELRAVPGNGTTAFVSVLPGRGAGGWAFSFADDISAPPQPTGVVMVTPEFFELANATARRGRLLTWQDDGRAEPVAVVNDSFARKFSRDRDVIGRRLRLGDRDFVVAGVVPDLRMQDPEDADADGIYLSMLQARPFAVRTMTSTSGAPIDALAGVRAAVARVDPDLPVLEPASLYDAIYADKQILDAMAALFLAFGLGTVFLALIGLFALLSFTVTARTREFGIRMALGASPNDILRIVLRRGGKELAWGLGIGLAIAVVISQVFAATMENVPTGGPEVFVAIVATVVAGAAIALWRPVRRAVRLSAVEALRH